MCCHQRYPINTNIAIGKYRCIANHKSIAFTFKIDPEPLSDILIEPNCFRKSTCSRDQVPKMTTNKINSQNHLKSDLTTSKVGLMGEIISVAFIKPKRHINANRKCNDTIPGNKFVVTTKLPNHAFSIKKTNPNRYHPRALPKALGFQKIRNPIATASKPLSTPNNLLIYSIHAFTG